MSLALLGGMVAGGAADFFGARSANKQNAAMFKRVMELLRSLQGEGRVAGAQALQERRGALRDVRGGFDMALAEIAGAGRAGETQARDIAEAQRGFARQELLNQGRYDAEGMVWHNRGISQDLMRALQSVREAATQQRAGLLAQRGAAMGDARGLIAGQIGQNFDRIAGVTDSMASVGLGNPSVYQPQGANIGALAYGLGQVPWSKLFGGGGGGGGGGGMGGFGLWSHLMKGSN